MPFHRKKKPRPAPAAPADATRDARRSGAGGAGGADGTGSGEEDGEEAAVLVEGSSVTYTRTTSEPSSTEGPRGVATSTTSSGEDSGPGVATVDAVLTVEAFLPLVLPRPVRRTAAMFTARLLLLLLVLLPCTTSTANPPSMSNRTELPRESPPSPSDTNVWCLRLYRVNCTGSMFNANSSVRLVTFARTSPPSMTASIAANSLASCGSHTCSGYSGRAVDVVPACANLPKPLSANPCSAFISDDGGLNT